LHKFREQNLGGSQRMIALWEDYNYSSAGPSRVRA
jgi:hypothetical protein